MPFSEDLQAELKHYGFSDLTEVALRHELEQRVTTYTLIKLAPWPARRWKCQYRLMMGDAFYDAQTVPEAYALALRAACQTPSTSSAPGTRTEAGE